MMLVHCILLGLLKNSGEHCFKNLFESQKTLLFIQFYFHFQDSCEHSSCKHVQHSISHSCLRAIHSLSPIITAPCLTDGVITHGVILALSFSPFCPSQSLTGSNFEKCIKCIQFCPSELSQPQPRSTLPLSDYGSSFLIISLHFLILLVKIKLSPKMMSPFGYMLT